MELAVVILKILGLVVEDVSEWVKGGDSTLDYSEFSKRLGGKFESEILLAREKARLAAKTTPTP